MLGGVLNQRLRLWNSTKARKVTYTYIRLLFALTDDSDLGPLGESIIAEIFKFFYITVAGEGSSKDRNLAYEVPKMFIYGAPNYTIIPNPPTPSPVCLEGADMVKESLGTTIKDLVIGGNSIGQNLFASEFSFTCYHVRMYYKQDCHMAASYLPIWEKIRTYMETFFYGMCTFSKIECTNPEALKELDRVARTRVKNLPYVHISPHSTHKVSNKFKMSQ
jgi:hypothetical protein